MNFALSAIATPQFQKFIEAVCALTTLVVTTDPVTIPPSPPITLVTIKELADIAVFLN